MLRRAWLIGCVVLSTPGLAAAADYVVATDGDDGSPGLAGSPWATLQHAADSVGPGDTVTVLPGDYAGFYLIASGTEGAPIVFSAQPGVSIVSPNGFTDQDGINVEDTDNGTVVSYVVIEGFTVNGMPRAGIRTAVSSHVTIRKNRTDQNGVWGILTGFADDVIIEDNECSRSADEHGIYFGNSADRPIIRRNLVWGNNGNGIHMNADASQGGDGIISDALVEANIIWDNGAAGGSGINCDGVQSSIIRNNLLYDAHASGISLYMIDAAEPAKDNVVVNNTILIASDGRWALNIREGSTGNRVYNNILWNEHSFRGAIDIAMDALPGFVSNNNLMIDRFTLDGNEVLELEGWQAATGQDAASSTAQPVFLDAPGDDYHSAPGAPQIDTGTGTEAPPGDLDGIARPQGAAVDIGAYEYCESGDCAPATGGAGPGGNGGAGPGGAGPGGNGSGGDGADGGGGSGGGGGSEGGCGCRTAGDGDSGGGPLFPAIAAVLAAASRGRRRRR